MDDSGPGSSTGLLIFMMASAWLGWVGFDLVSSYSYQGGLFADPTLTMAMRLALFCTLALTNGMAVIAIGCLVRLVQLLLGMVHASSNPSGGVLRIASSK